MLKILAAMALMAPAPFASHDVEFVGAPELVHRGLVSTEKFEVKLAVSPDGRRMLWGVVSKESTRGWEIYESVKGRDGSWSAASPVSFDSDANDFDPAFAPDASGVYFFSNRPGGLGGDDVWFAPFDRKRGTYGAAVNLGASVNSKGDEWGPALSPDGKRLLFCTDGRGGAGKHDLFVSKREGKGWSAPERLGGAINSAADDFDAVFLSDGRTIVFASGDPENGPVTLYTSAPDGSGYGAPVALPAAFNSPSYLNFGCSTSPGEPGVLYVTSNHEGNSVGRADLYRVHYRFR